ncbi:MAG: FHA domain-containing protein [Deltaproteobacteria bacterium]|nr:FHA domain-containing protein [Deltaproteobacteria bacterium]
MATEGPVYQIAIVDDEGQVTTVPMIRDDFTIGRKEGNVIRLTERNVSRNHARIARENGRFFLSDQGSYNGTRLNGRRVRGKMPLSPGDEVGIGDYTLRMEVLEGAAAAAAPAAAPAEPVKPSQITVVVEGKPNTVYILSDVPHVIGRGDECTIRIDEPGVSRAHARMHLVQGRYFVEDAGSANGLLVGGQRVRSKALDPGDVIEIGRVQLYFTVGALKPEDVKSRAAAAGGGSRLPMIFGIVGALIALLGVVYLLFLRGKDETKGTGAEGTVAEADAGPPVLAAAETGTPPEPDAGIAAAPEAGAEAVAVEEEAGPSTEELLAKAREAAVQAATVADWNGVLELLAAKELSADAAAAELRASATREHDARLALDEAKQAMTDGDPATASKRLAAVPPDVRCASEAAPMWNDVIVAGRDAARAQRVADLETIVEALRQIVAPPPRVARGRDELEAALRRLSTQVSPPPPADAGASRRDAGGGATEVRIRTDAGVAPPRDTGGTAPPPADNSYDQARQMVLAGNNQGCIDILSRAPQSSRNLELLITCYKAAGRMPDAHNAMLSYVTRYPTARKADEYRGVLQAAGRMP